MPDNRPERSIFRHATLMRRRLERGCCGYPRWRRLLKSVAASNGEQPMRRYLILKCPDNALPSSTERLSQLGHHRLGAGHVLDSCGLKAEGLHRKRGLGEVVD